MKFTLLLSLLSISFSVFSQSAHEALISQVETGLVKQTIMPAGTLLASKQIHDQLKAHKVNGVSIAVIDNYEINWAKTYGVADKNTGSSVTQETLFQCASIGKVITAVAALQLVRQQKIDLDEDVNNKLTSWKLTENAFTIQEKVTLRRLLSHSAGLLDDYGFKGYKPKDKLPTLLQILRNEPPSNAKKVLKVEAVPGTVERYSGGGYLIIQQLIEDVTGQPFQQYVAENIFAQLGMSNTTYQYQPDLELKRQIARGHYKSGKVDQNVPYHLYPEMAAAGPWTTAVDLAKLVIQIQKEYAGTSDALLGQQLCQTLLSPQISNKGLGVNLKGVHAPQAFWHSGNNAGYTGLLYGTLSSGQGAVVLTNSDAGEHLAQEIITSIANTYAWPVMQAYVSAEITQTEIQKLSGTYKSDNGSVVTIGQNEKGLFVIPSSPKKEIPLYKIGENRFTTAEAADYFTLSFDKENEMVTGITFTQSLGKISKLKRVR